MRDEQRQGWVGVVNGKRYHYVRGTRALCGATILGGTPELGNDDSPDNCARCKRNLAAMRARFPALYPPTSEKSEQ